MGLTHIPDMDTATSTSDDHLFASPKLQPAEKMLVCMPTDECLCNKLKKLNLTLVEGYPSRSSEAGRLFKDQFFRPAKSQAKWYRLYSNQQKTDPASVSSWNSDASKLNSSYSRIARAAGLASTPSASRQIWQERSSSSVTRPPVSTDTSTKCKQVCRLNSRQSCLITARGSPQARFRQLLMNFSTLWTLTPALAEP